MTPPTRDEEWNGSRPPSPRLKRLIKEKEQLAAELDNLDVWWKAFVPRCRDDLQRVTIDLERNFMDIYFECVHLTKAAQNKPSRA